MLSAWAGYSPASTGAARTLLCPFLAHVSNLLFSQQEGSIPLLPSAKWAANHLTSQENRKDRIPLDSLGPPKVINLFLGWDIDLIFFPVPCSQVPSDLVQLLFVSCLLFPVHNS